MVEGTIVINKVPGNFHISTHAYSQMVQRLYMSGRHLDFSHDIHFLQFGEETHYNSIKYNFGDTFDSYLKDVSIRQ
jgi:hypothetical protein